MRASEYDELLQHGPRLLGVPAVPLLALIVANLLPIVGVVALGWDLLSVLLLYWAENVVVGFWALARMLVIAGAKAIPIGIFFCVHFGLFMFVHLTFVYVLTSFGRGDMPDFFPASTLLQDLPVFAVLALWISHGVSFVKNFLASGEYRKTNIGTEMARPYPRMAVMHIAIIVSGWFIMLLGQPIAMLVILVLMKLAIDVAAHVAEHRLMGTRKTTTE